MKSLKKVLLALSAILATPIVAQANADVVNYIRFRPDGKILWLRSTNPYNSRTNFKSAFFNTSTRKLTKTLPFHTILFAPDNSYYVGSGTPMKAYSWAGKLLRTYPSFGGVGPVSMSPDGNLLIGTGEGPYYGLWNARSGELITRFGLGEPAYFSKNSRTIYANSEHAPALFKVPENNSVRKIRSFGWTRGGFDDFDVDEKRGLLCAVSLNLIADARTTRATVFMFNLQGKTLAKFRMTIFNERFAASVRFSRDGRYIAIRNANEIFICSPRNLKVLRHYKPKSFGVRVFTAIEFSPTENLLAVGGWGKFAPMIVRLP